MSSEWDGTPWAGDPVTMTQVQDHQLDITLDDATADLFGRRVTGATARTYRLPSVKEVLGVPSIHRAVSLIASTTGMLSIQGYRNGDQMTDPPRLILRPDPYETPQSFYSGTAANMAKYGEFVWWIAQRDTDGLPASLVNVPLAELNVQENPSNRLDPFYYWGRKQGRRYSGANPDGQFVHYLYPLGEPLALRGAGPLQLCRAATSVTVEAQAFAAQFYAEGGTPSVLIKHAGMLSGTLDPDGNSEADRLRNQWVSRPHNVPRIIDQSIESVTDMTTNTQGAQMLEARQYQNGDAARMFGVPGSLLEYQSAGSSLTYQNLEGEFTKFVRGCLQPLYLEPIEQAMSDLLTRSTVARFNVKGFLRADVKTRYEVHGIAIDKGIYGPDYAQREEGILPGDVEFAPVPFAQPQAIPAPLLPRAASRNVRCPNPNCGKLLARALGVGSEMDCPRCKTAIRVA